MNVVLNKLNTIASYAAAISLVIILLVTSVSINCFDSDFYKSEYKTLQTAQDLGMTQKDLNLATNTLLEDVYKRQGYLVLQHWPLPVFRPLVQKTLNHQSYHHAR